MRLAIVLAVLLVNPLAWGKEPRSAAVKRAFALSYPCPATSLPRPSCAGYVLDHIEPLCAGGRDHPDNLQWQTIADAKLKDRDEHRLCRAIKRGAEAPQGPATSTTAILE